MLLLCPLQKRSLLLIGDAYGKGQIREKELLAACERLRVRMTLISPALAIIDSLHLLIPYGTSKVPKAQITIVKDPRLKVSLNKLLRLQ